MDSVHMKAKPSEKTLTYQPKTKTFVKPVSHIILIFLELGTTEATKPKTPRRN